MLRGRFAATEQVSPAESMEDVDRAADEKKPGFATDSEAEIVLENGHLQELEVDMAEAIKDADIEDFDLDHSPFPEVLVISKSRDLHLKYTNSCAQSSGRSRCR